MKYMGRIMGKLGNGTGRTFFFLGMLLLIAPVFALAQEENVCIKCHGSLTGRLGEPVPLWKGSIHAANAIACNDCHGGDPKDAANAMSPVRGFLGAPKEVAIPGFCGRCHVGVKNDYLQSAHGRALGKGGPTCVTCHGNHLVVKASLELINEKSCSRCHTFARAAMIKSAMEDTDNLIIAIDGRINAFKREGVDTERLEKGLFSARNRFHTLFHDVDVERVKKEAAGIQADLHKLDATLRAMAEERQRWKLAGAIAMGLALIAALLFHLLRKTYD
jgi:hypothetical protein